MTPQGEQRTGGATHERRDADVINLFMIAGLLILMLVISLLICWGVLHHFNREQTAEQRPAIAPMARETVAFPQPRLLVRPRAEREKFQKGDQAQLETYGWVDRRTGLVRIPIARAMQLLVERGLPEVGAGQTRLQLMQSRAGTNVAPIESNSSPGPEATP